MKEEFLRQIIMGRIGELLALYKEAGNWAQGIAMNEYLRGIIDVSHYLCAHDGGVSAQQIERAAVQVSKLLSAAIQDAVASPTNTPDAVSQCPHSDPTPPL